MAAWALSAPPDCDVTMLAMLPMIMRPAVAANAYWSQIM